MRSLLAASCLLALAPAAAANAVFDEFRCTLTGHWDNLAQAAADIARGAPDNSRHPRRAMTYVPVVAPAIEGQLFAILNYGEHGFEGPLGRVSLHRFRPDGDAIVHEFMFLLDKSRWGDLAASLEPLAGLDEEDVRINGDCAMRWHKHGEHFEGGTMPGACVTSSFTPEPILVEGHGELRGDLLLRHDQNFTLQGEPLPVPGGDSPERFERVARSHYDSAELRESIRRVSALDIDAGDACAGSDGD